ncbi:MAG: ABC transporter permease [Planctomycetaceae bacterium]
MLAGPIFNREVITTPRKTSHYLLRAGYIAALFVLMYTTRQTTIGFQEVRNIGDVARFGGLVFQVFSIVQLSLVMFFALLLTAGNIAQEKDRRTLILLLMTDLRSREMVLGKLGASLLVVFVLIAASAPVMCFLYMLGGISTGQIAWSLAITAATAIAAGSWGALVAFWREKTFQTLAISVLGIVAFLVLLEGTAALIPGEAATVVATALNPYRAMSSVLNPLANIESGVASVSALVPVIALMLLAVGMSVFTIKKLRVWNPSQLVYQRLDEEEDGATESRVKHRRIWTNPVIWREICTRAYGRKIIFIKLAYIAIAALVTWYLATNADDGSLVLGMVSRSGFAFVALTVISLLLINAQAVTSLTSERDGQTLELLLATDVTAKEFILGKIGGALWNSKELIIVPFVMLGYLMYAGRLGVTTENTIYIVIGYTVLVMFAAMLGLHSGLSYENSRSSISNSLGTIFFLFIGIFVFMILLVEARSSFAIQFQSFLIFIIVGSMGLYGSLTHKNPSNALTLAAALLPFLTFYSITEFLLQGSLGVCMWITVAYGFTTIAMLVPAVSDFDVALGRTTSDNG